MKWDQGCQGSQALGSCLLTHIIHSALLLFSSALGSALASCLLTQDHRRVPFPEHQAPPDNLVSSPHQLDDNPPGFNQEFPGINTSLLVTPLNHVRVFNRRVEENDSTSFDGGNHFSQSWQPCLRLCEIELRRLGNPTWRE